MLNRVDQRGDAVNVRTGSARGICWNRSQRCCCAGGSRQRTPAPLFQFDEGPGVRQGISTDGHHLIIAAKFALHPYPMGDPPDHRMVEQQGFHYGLNKIEEIIVAPDMSQLVNQDRLDLLWSHTDQDPCRHQDHRTQPANDHGHLNQARFQQLYGAADL